MQEDDREASEGQPEPDGQPPPESGVDESQPEPDGQPPPESGVDESQSEPKPDGQPPPATPIPLPPTQQQKRRQYLLGLVFGLIPLILFLVFYGIALGGNAGAASTFFSLSLCLGPLLYIAELVVTIVFLSSKEKRFAGYGLLTAFLVTPIVAAIGCSVIFPNLIHPA